MASVTPAKIILKSSTKVSLNDRFTVIMKTRPAPASNVRARAATERLASEKNRRLAQQMERRPAVAAELDGRRQPVQQRLGGRIAGGRTTRGLGGTTRGLGRTARGVNNQVSTFSRLGRGQPWTRRPGRFSYSRGAGGRGRGFIRRGRFTSERVASSRGRGRGRGRGQGGRRGRGGRPAAPVDKNALDQQLDSYMSKTKGSMDAELDTYMADING